MYVEVSDLPPAAVGDALDDLTAWMVKYDWMTGLTEGQVREVCRDVVGRVLESAVPAILAAERARIRALAVEADARYRVPRPCGCADVSCNASRYVDRPFADMLAGLEPARAADSTTEV